MAYSVAWESHRADIVATGHVTPDELGEALSTVVNKERTGWLSGLLLNLTHANPDAEADWTYFVASAIGLCRPGTQCRCAVVIPTDSPFADALGLLWQLLPQHFRLFDRRDAAEAWIAEIPWSAAHGLKRKTG